MYPRFGMAHVAIQTAQARARAAQTTQRHDAAPAAYRAVFSDPVHNGDLGVLWRMAGIIAVIAAVTGIFAWLVA